MASSIPILFLTNAEHGQANIVLATAQTVAEKKQEFKVHIASFASLQERVDDVNARNENLAHAIQFHLLRGRSMGDLANKAGGTDGVSGNAHAPGFLNAARSYVGLEATILGWKPEEYLEVYRQCRQIIQDVAPASLVVEVGLWQAHDAARSLGLDYVVISPGMVKDLVAPLLPGAPMLVKWPATGSGLSYPLSLIDRLKNILLMIWFILILLTGTNIAKIKRARKEAGLTHQFPIFDMYQKGNLHLWADCFDTDYGQIDGMPSNVVNCGPIVLPPLKSAGNDRGLMDWLEKRRTILINLGSHFATNPTAATEMAKGVRIVLDAEPDIQVLWKLKYDWSKSDEIKTQLSDLVKSDRLRIQSWIDIDPANLLMTGHFVCAVHHGGANSYYEACKSGVPQVILPVWWDTYQFADRARYLNIGVVGNVGVAPGVEGRSFAASLLRALNDDQFRDNAHNVAAACRRLGEGRQIAADAILNWAMERSRLKD